MKILNQKIKVGDIVTFKSKEAPNYLQSFGVVVGFTKTNLNTETNPGNPLCNKTSIPFNSIEEIKKHKDIKKAIEYSNEKYLLKPIEH